MTTPLADFVSMFNPPANDSLTLTVPKEDGVGNYIFNNLQQILIIIIFFASKYKVNRR